MFKSRKQIAAPLPPGGQSNRTDNSPIAQENLQINPTKKETPQRSAGQDVPKSKDVSEVAVEKPKLEQASAHSETLHEHEVIHYHPQASNFPTATASDPIDSDFPYVERKSNIILNDSGGYKTIRVTQYDGTMKKPKCNIAAPSPSALLKQSSSSSLKSNIKSHSSLTNTTLDKNRLDHKVACSKPGSNTVSLEHLSTNINEGAAEINREYEKLKRKFDLWQLLQTRNRNSPQAKQLQMELMCEHDTLMKKLEHASGFYAPTTKKRPAIAPDTFWSPNDIRQQPPSVAISNSSGALNSRWTSNHSLSPTASTSSEETDKSSCDGTRTKAVVTSSVYALLGSQTNNEVWKKEIRSSASSSEVDEQKKKKEQALQRVLEEASDLRRREEELRGFSGSSIQQKEEHSVSSSPIFSRYEKLDDAKVPFLQKKFHEYLATDTRINSTSRINPDGNNNATLNFVMTPANNQLFSNRSDHLLSLQEISHVGDASFRPPSSSQPLHSFRRQDADDMKMATGQLDYFTNSYADPNIDAVRGSAKLHLRSMHKETLENSENPSLPTTPNLESNIRKVKAAAKKQSLGKKSCNTILLQTHLAAMESQSLREEVKRASLEGVISTVSKNQFDNSVNEQMERNVTNTLGEKSSSSNDVELPVKKNSVIVAKDAVLPSGNQLKEVLRQTTAKQRLDEDSSTTVSSPPPTPPPPPPPPPPLNLLSHTGVPQTSTVRHSISLVSIQELEHQKAKLKQVAMFDKAMTPLDVRDSLMAEIRNAGGLRALRNTTAPKN